MLLSAFGPFAASTLERSEVLRGTLSEEPPNIDQTTASSNYPKPPKAKTLNPQKKQPQAPDNKQQPDIASRPTQSMALGADYRH